MKPQDFLIGVRDFFAVLVPGAVLLMLLLPAVATNTGGGAIRFVGLAIAAYLLGSVADRLGSLLDLPLDPIVRAEWIPFTKKAHARKREAEKCRQQLIDGCGPPVELELAVPLSPRMFWWDHLRLSCPAAIQELDRIEGAQKLFRSLTATFLIGAVAIHFGYAETSGWPPAARQRPVAMLLLLAFLSAILYAIGRFAFRAVLFRLAVAYCIHKRAGEAAAPVGLKRN